MSLIRRLRVWWDDLSWMREAQEFIDNFPDVYTASGGPRPMDKRRTGETMREYRVPGNARNAVKCCPWS